MHTHNAAAHLGAAVEGRVDEGGVADPDLSFFPPARLDARLDAHRARRRVGNQEAQVRGLDEVGAVGVGRDPGAGRLAREEDLERRRAGGLDGRARRGEEGAVERVPLAAVLCGGWAWVGVGFRMGG